MTYDTSFNRPSILKEEGKPVALGFLVEKEVLALTRCVDVKEEDRPYIAILGGLKVSDKIKVIESLLNKCDKILIGGAMAFTFLKALGNETGKSPVEDDQLEYARNCLAKANGRIVLPVDTVIADAFEGWTETRIVSVGEIPADFQGLDIGPETRKLFADLGIKTYVQEDKRVFPVTDSSLKTIQILKRHRDIQYANATDEERNYDLIKRVKDLDDKSAKVVCNLVYYDGTKYLLYTNNINLLKEI